MALSNLVAYDFIPRLKKGDRIASMGYPDIITPEPLLKKLIGELKYSMLTFRQDSARICKRHNIDYRLIPDADSLFDLMGAKLDVFDIVEYRGGEILCDLNYPIPQKEQYDYVLDVGTAEHCFNIGQAIINMAQLLKKDGTIFHSNPFVMGNHGFYGLNPTLFSDFYGQPGFRLDWLRLMISGSNEVLDVPPVKRFQAPAAEVDIFAAATRTEVREITYPTQYKYVILAAAAKPGVKGVENE